MFKRWYEIIGITPAMYEEWKDDLRKDIIAWEQDGMVHAHINLDPIEALWMKFQMYVNNHKKGTHYYFNLVRI